MRGNKIRAKAETKMQMPPINHKARLLVRGRGTWRSIARRILFFVILLIIILGVLEHNRLSAPCAGGRWRVMDDEVVCVYSLDADEGRKE